MYTFFPLHCIKFIYFHLNQDGTNLNQLFHENIPSDRKISIFSYLFTYPRSITVFKYLMSKCVNKLKYVTNMYIIYMHIRFNDKDIV